VVDDAPERMMRTHPDETARAMTHASAAVAELTRLAAELRGSMEKMLEKCPNPLRTVYQARTRASGPFFMAD